MYTLIVGTQDWSSWSLRPYLALMATGAKFKVEVIRLRLPESRAAISLRDAAERICALRQRLRELCQGQPVVAFAKAQHRRGNIAARTGYQRQLALFRAKAGGFQPCLFAFAACGQPAFQPIGPYGV